LPIDRKEIGKTGDKQETENLSKLIISGADNERETRGKTEKEQRKSRETRRICSLIISRRIGRIQRLF
jgi:hypothetical protein